MIISKSQSKRQDWDQTKSWNYKLKHLSPYQSIVYAEITNDHGEVNTNDVVLLMELWDN